jgi:hypothetical protein
MRTSSQVRTSHVPPSPAKHRRAALAVAATLAVAGVATAADGAAAQPGATHQASSASRATVKGGRVGPSITLAHNVSFDGDTLDARMATDKSGTTYISWMSSKDNDKSGSRLVHLCVIPNNARACAGGTKTLDPTDDTTNSGLQMIVTPSGQVTILWIGNDGGGGSHVYDTTATKSGALSSPDTKLPSSLPSNSTLLDAQAAPGGAIWLLLNPDSSTSIQLRRGLTASPTTIHTPRSYPSGVGGASLAFSGSKAIIAIGANASILSPLVDYATASGSSVSGFKTIANAATNGTTPRLVHTRSGVRLLAGDAKNFYQTAISKWTGHGFTRAAAIGGSIDLSAVDASTDPSGRLLAAGDDSQHAGKVTVINFADTVHPASFSFGIGAATNAGGGPTVSTSARGRGWVSWSYQGGNSTNGDTLLAAPIVLAGLHAKKTVHGKHGKVTVVGPASCLPPVSISVSVTGHATSGWKVSKRKLTLGGKKLGKSLNGARLSAGKSYRLVGTVTFAKGHSHEKVKAALTFRSCPS